MDNIETLLDAIIYITRLCKFTGCYNSFVRYPVLWQVYSFLQSKLFTEYDLVCHLSSSSIISFPQVHSVHAYVFFLVFPPLISFLHYCVLEGSSYTRCDQSSQSYIILLHVGCSSPPLLYVIFHHFSHALSNGSPSFSSTTFRNCQGISDLLS